MALLITDTNGGNPQRLRCADGRGKRLQALAVFVLGKEVVWHF
jgi:hypothetical protein